MRDKGEQWECPRCFFFYKPLIPGTIPKKYQQAAFQAVGSKPEAVTHFGNLNGEHDIQG